MQNWSSYLGTVFGFGGGTADFGGFDVDWGALLIVAFVTVILAWGTKLSAEVSLVITVIKVSVVLLVVIVGAFYIKTANYSPFIPPPQGAEGGTGSEQSLFSLLTGAEGSHYGWYGVLAGASIVFFAFHRLRYRRDHRRGDQEPAARCVPRHPGLTGHRHRPLRRRGRRALGHGALHRAP
jgi:APA family basic amino acid/polyamine antiporter